ncbi:hypothetical protein LAZ67_22000762 [Cordylochernes scorpioides]|uniref:Transposase n=1 Tax=Cordylochernes scorpioides TaxID=51811 RepID=A0ABY6LNS9_9ARAC|nr:hypothetical protein LAZ67_22000762 [Cordylochernes scorpioides]
MIPIEWFNPTNLQDLKVLLGRINGLKNFVNAALCRSRTFERFSHFQKGREEVNDYQHTGRPRTLRCGENKLKMKELIKLSDEFLLKTCLHRLSYLDKRFGPIRTSSKFVPRILTEEQKEVRMEVCQNMIEMTRIDPEWSPKIITAYDPETKRQSSQWIERGEPKPKKAKFAKVKAKIVLVTFFRDKLFGRECALKNLKDGKNNEWIPVLHVDNARPHTAHIVLQSLTKHSTT